MGNAGPMVCTKDERVRQDAILRNKQLTTDQLIVKTDPNFLLNPKKEGVFSFNNGNKNGIPQNDSGRKRSSSVEIIGNPALGSPRRLTNHDIKTLGTSSNNEQITEVSEQNETTIKDNLNETQQKINDDNTQIEDPI